jgi:hypothetical protein
MAIEAQVLANRRNAPKSTGPRIPEGEAVVSQKAGKKGKPPDRRAAYPSCQVANHAVIMQDQGRMDMFDNCRESSTNRAFLCKTKPISEKAEMNASSVLTKDYERISPRGVQKGKAKQSQFPGAQRSYGRSPFLWINRQDLYPYQIAYNFDSLQGEGNANDVPAGRYLDAEFFVQHDRDVVELKARG